MYNSDISFLQLTRNGKLLIVVNSKECAKEILPMEKTNKYWHLCTFWESDKVFVVQHTGTLYSALSSWWMISIWMLKIWHLWSENNQYFLDWVNSSDLYIWNLHIPTRFDGSHASLLDIIIVLSDLYDKVHFNIHPDMFNSDHCPIAVYIESPTLSKSKPTGITIITISLAVSWTSI